MKEKVTAALVQFAPAWLERERNAERMAEWAEREAAQGAELVVFPELANVGFITPVRLGEKASFSEEETPLEFLVNYRRAAEPIPGPSTGRSSAPLGLPRPALAVPGSGQAEGYICTTVMAAATHHTQRPGSRFSREAGPSLKCLNASLTLGGAPY